MKFEVDVSDINPDSLISLLIKRIEELEKLQNDYREHVLGMEKALQEFINRYSARLSRLEGGKVKYPVP